MPKLSQKLSSKTFILSQILILVIGLTFLAGLDYILNIQYQQNSNSYTLKGPVTTSPKGLRLALEQPDDDTLTFQSSIIVSGKTASHMQVLITTDSQDLVVKSSSNGSFSTVLKLDQGVNNITAVVFDATGDNKSEQRTVYYSKEKI